MWYNNATNQDCKALQRVVRLAERISGSTLPSLQGHSTSNAAEAELLKSPKTQTTPVTIFSVYCHLAGATGAWWQRQRDWGRASSLRPSGSLTQTLFHKLSQDSLLSVKKKKITKTFIFSSSILPLCVHTQYNPLHIPLIPPVYTNIYLVPYNVFAHPICFAHLTVLLFLHFSLFYCTFYLFRFLPIYIYSCVVLLLYNLIVILFLIFFYSLNCPLSGPDLTYISLLIIPCIIYHVTNKETLNLEHKQPHSNSLATTWVTNYHINHLDT